MHRHTNETPLRKALVALTLTVAAGSGSAAALFAAQDDPVEDARTTLEQWVETRRVLSQERRDCRLGREMLEDRVELVASEIEGLRGRIGDTEGSIAAADADRAQLVEENERLKQASSQLSETIVTLEGRTKALLERLPDPLRDRVAPLAQRLPKDSAATKLSLGERFQNVVGILNEVDKWNREIAVASEVRDLPGGATAEVTAMYVGLGQGYYVSPNGEAAGYGTVGAGGWEWTPADEAAAEIARAIAVQRNEQPADFVPLPVRIDGAQEGQ